MSDIRWEPVRVRLRDLRPWERNPRQMSKRAAERLLQSWREYGQVQTVAIGPNGEVYDGHQRLSALLSVYGPDYEILALRASRTLTEQERERLVLLLHAGAVGEWDWDALANWDADALIASGFDEEMLDALDRDAAALAKLLESAVADVVDEPPDALEAQVDRAEELRAAWGVEPGQLWRIPSRSVPGGEHRIICGDSTAAETVARLMQGERAVLVFTDPPYGVSIGAKNRLLNSVQKAGRSLDDIAGDDEGPDELYRRLLPAFEIVRTAVMAEDCSVFVTAPQGGDLGLMMMMMRDAGLPVRHVLIWVKNAPTFSLGRLDYDYQHEPILFTWGKKHKRYKRGPHTTSVWSIDKPRRSSEHPTMKPVELVENALLNHTDDGDIAYDPFLGSGTTLVACERLGRLGRGVEIEPKYVAVALQRLADMGLEPELVE